MSRLLWWRTRKGDYQRTFENDSGRRVLKEIYRAGGVGSQCHVPGDPYETAFNEGKRRIALMIARALNETEAEFLARSQSTEDGEYGEEF